MPGTTLQTINASLHPETQMNDNFESLSAVAIFSKRQPVTANLTWGYYGGQFAGANIADANVTLTNNATNNIVVARANGVVSASNGSSNWSNSAYGRLYQVVTANGLASSVTDARMDQNGLLRPRHTQTPNAQTANYILALSDVYNWVEMNNANDRVLTVPSHANVAFDTGVFIPIARLGAGNVTVSAQANVTVHNASSNTLRAQYSVGGLYQRAQDEWVLSGDVT
jgi:hypothetical protein